MIKVNSGFGEFAFACRASSFLQEIKTLHDVRRQTTAVQYFQGPPVLIVHHLLVWILTPPFSDALHDLRGIFGGVLLEILFQLLRVGLPM